jgi:hypothetical protein
VKYLYYNALLIFPFISNVPAEVGFVEAFFAILLLGALFGSALKSLITGDFRLIGSRLILLLWTFFFVVLAGAVTNYCNEIPLRSLFRAVAPVGILVISAMFVANEFRTHKDVRSLIVVFIIASLIFSAKNLIMLTLSHVTEVENVYQSVKFDIITPQQSYQVFRLAGGVLLIGVLWRWQHIQRIRKVLLKLSFVVIISSIMVTFSRGMILSFLFTAILSIFYLYRRYGMPKNFFSLRHMDPVSLMGVVVIGVVIIFLMYSEWIKIVVKLGYPILESILRLFYDEKSYAISSRMLEHIIFLQDFQEAPIFGHGVGYEIPYYFPDGTLFKYVSYTHNMFTYLLLYTGVFGTSIFVVLVASSLVKLLKLSRSRFAEMQGIAGGMIFSALAVLLYVQFNPFFKGISFNLFLGIAIGIASNCGRFLRAENIAVGGSKIPRDLWGRTGKIYVQYIK